MLRFFASLLFLTVSLPAFAQSCNSPSGFIKVIGQINIGDLLSLGPDCNSVQSFTGGSFTNLFATTFTIPNEINAGEFRGTDAVGNIRNLLTVSNNTMAANATRLISAGGGITLENLARNPLASFLENGQIGFGTVTPAVGARLDIEGGSINSAVTNPTLSIESIGFEGIFNLNGVSNITTYTSGATAVGASIYGGAINQKGGVAAGVLGALRDSFGSENYGVLGVLSANHNGGSGGAGGFFVRNTTGSAFIPNPALYSGVNGASVGNEATVTSAPANAAIGLYIYGTCDAGSSVSALCPQGAVNDNTFIVGANILNAKTEMLRFGSNAGNGNLAASLIKAYAHDNSIAYSLSSNAQTISVNSSPPSPPPSGYVAGWADASDLRWHDKNSSGIVGTTVVSDTGTAHNFLTAVGTNGVISKAQPVAADVVGVAALAANQTFTGVNTFTKVSHYQVVGGTGAGMFFDTVTAGTDQWFLGSDSTGNNFRLFSTASAANALTYAPNASSALGVFSTPGKIGIGTTAPATGASLDIQNGSFNNVITNPSLSVPVLGFATNFAGISSAITLSAAGSSSGTVGVMGQVTNQKGGVTAGVQGGIKDSFGSENYGLIGVLAVDHTGGSGAAGGVFIRASTIAPNSTLYNGQKGFVVGNEAVISAASANAEMGLYIYSTCDPSSAINVNCPSGAVNDNTFAVGLNILNAKTEMIRLGSDAGNGYLPASLIKAYAHNNSVLFTLDNTGSITTVGNIILLPAASGTIFSSRLPANTNYLQYVWQDQTGAGAAYLGLVGTSAGLGGRNGTFEIGSTSIGGPYPITVRPNETEAMRFQTDGSVLVSGALRYNSTISTGGSLGITTTCTIAVGNVLTFTNGIITAKGGVAGCT